MARKTIIVVWLVALAFAPFCLVEAQQPTKVPRIGFLIAGSRSAYTTRVDALRQGLRDLGYIEGQNIVIESRYADGKENRLPDLAAELVQRKVEVIIATGTQASSAAKKATTTIPIVMGAAGDPVGTGLVASLARPGGNVTGLASISPDVSGKRPELLMEVIPKVSLVAVLSIFNDPTSALQLKETQEAVRSLRVHLQMVELGESNDFDSIFGAAKKARAGALDVLSSTFITAHRKEILVSAAKNRLPAIYDDREFTEAGGLMSYRTNRVDMYRRAATYVDKVLKGAKPGDLPVERPMKFEFVINLKAAKQIGLTIPQSVLFRADNVIK
jgi:putative ABC transport system substrate-binding protein